MAHAEHAVVFSDVSVRRSGLDILCNVNAVVPSGTCTVVVGPNGAGKTTLILALLGEVAHTGRIALYGPDGRPPRLGYVPQRLNPDRSMPLTVMELLVAGRQKRPVWLGLRRDLRERAENLLESVRAGRLARRRVGDLSGGELQRVLLALALDRDPDLLLLDEPSAGLDVQGEYLLCELLDELRLSRGFTQFMISHDLGMVAHHADHVICLNRRVVAQGAPRDVLTDEALNALFGLHMGLMRFRGDEKEAVRARP